jgi:serine/threonine protein kinase
MADKNLGSGFVSELESGFLASGFTTADTSTNYTETLLSDQGAMSDTYRRKSQSGKIEIVKRIKSKYKDDETYKQLFIQEFNVLDGMQNEYVVSIHNHGKDSQGLFYVMEYVDGKTLAEVSAEEKNAVSHRANALKVFYEKMKEAGYADK